MPTEQQEQEAAKDLAQRVQALNVELKALLEKHRLSLGSEAFLLPDGCIGSRAVIVDPDQAQKDEGLVKPE